MKGRGLQGKESTRKNGRTEKKYQQKTFVRQVGKVIEND